MARRTTVIEYVRMRVVDEDSFPTQAEARDTTIDTTAEELPSGTRMPLAKAYQGLAKWLGGER